MSAAAIVVIVIAACGRNSSPSTMATVPSPAAAVVTVTLSGIVREAGTMRFLPGARLVVTSGPDAGASAVSDATGAFLLPSLSIGTIDLEGSKDGYLAAKVPNLALRPDLVIDVPLYAAPPRDAGGARATARCFDASWTWSVTPAQACAGNGGVATAYVRARSVTRKARTYAWAAAAVTRR